MKKLITFLFTLLISVTSMLASEINGIYYELDLTTQTAKVISGTNKYTGAVSIPATVNYMGGVEFSVTSIGDEAFYGCSDLTSVDIPNTVTSIGIDAFNGTGLTSVTISSSEINIGSRAFGYIESLSSLIITSDVKSLHMDWAAFQRCPITNITVDEENTVYDSRDNCNAIIETATNTLVRGCANTTIPSTVEHLGYGAFGGCGLTSIDIPNSVVTIGDNAYSDNNLTVIKIPVNVTTMGYDVFWESPNLTSVIVEWNEPIELLELSDGTFFGVDLANVTLYVPYGTKDTYEAADVWKDFGNIVEMEAPSQIIEFADDNVKALCVANWDTSGDGELSMTEAAAVTDLGEVFQNNHEITSFEELLFFTGLSEIAENAFYNCSNLTSITIPDNITTIGEDAFYETRNMQRVNISNLEAWCNIDFKSQSSNPLYKAHYLYLNGERIDDLVIPSSVEMISSWVFTIGYFNSVTIPSTTRLYNCGQGAFRGAHIGELTIKQAPGNMTFYAATINHLVIDPSVTSVDDQAFYLAKIGTLEIPYSEKDLKWESGRNSDGLFEDSEIETAIVDRRILASFYGSHVESTFKSTTIAELRIGSHVIYWSDNLCSGCTITDLFFDDVTEVSSNALYSSSRSNVVRHLHLPEGLTSISDNAFSSLSLSAVTVENLIPLAINSNVFSDWTYTNATLYVPEGTKAAYQAADVWKDFGNIVETSGSDISPDEIYLLKNVETGKYLFTGNAWGTHAVLADVGLPIQFNKQSDGSYTIFFPVGSGNQQMLFRANEVDVYVDYYGEGCPFWTFTNTGNGNYLIQTLTTHETYGQEALPDTYLGNDPNKEAYDQKDTALGVFNDVDGNVTNAEGMNITWTLEPVSARSTAQVSLLQELITTAQGLDLDTSEEEILLNNQEATYLEMTGTIVDLQKRIKEREDDLDKANKKKEDLNKLIACANAINVETDDAQAVADNSSSLDEINEAINTLHEVYITKLGEGVATTLLPLDVTGVILNPSFVIDDADSWNWNEGEDGPGFQCWNNAEFFQTTFDIHQQLTGLPNGKYLLKVKGFHRPGANGDMFSDYMQGTDNARAQLYANDKSVTLVNQASCALEEQIDGWSGLEVSHDGTTRYVPDNMHDAYMWFRNGYYENELPVIVTDGTFTLGIRLDESVDGGWVIFDDFRLYYQGEIVEFADDNVKAICVANWDTDGDGELSMAEAAAVTDLGEVFKENEEITSFDELQYFTGLTSIGEGAFNGCTSLNSITLPNGITSVGSFALSGCWNLQTIDIPNGVTSIGDDAFSWCINLSSVTIPASVTSIDEYAFSQCGNLTSITVNWEEPLAVPENIFENINYNNVTLYVPEGTKAAYKAADVWKEFFMDGDDRDEYNTKRLLRELIANMEAIGGYALDDAKATAYGVDVTKDDVEGAIAQLQQQIKDRCANAESNDLPVDATGLITNPSFTIDTNAYWSGETPQFQAYNNAEYFQTTFDIHQQLTGLPNGSYLLKVKGFHRPGTNGDVFSDYMQGTDNACAQLYANDKSVTLVNQASCALEEQIDGWSGLEVSHDGTTRYVPDNMHDAYMWFRNGYYENELPVIVTDGTFTLGIRLDESVDGGWVIFDDFRLEYLGNGRLYVDETDEPVAIYQGKTAKVGLMLDNGTTLTNFQFLIQLPEGFSLHQEKGKFACALNSDRIDGHKLTVEEVGDGLYKFLCSNMQDKPFKNNSGELLSLTLFCDMAVEADTYQATVRSIKFLDEHNEYVTFADFTFDMAVSELTTGDVNDNGSVDVQDLQLMVKHMLDKPITQTFILEAADHDNNGVINVMDIVEEIDLIMSIPEGDAPANTTTFDALGSGLSLVTGGDGAVHLRLADGAQYVASQFVVTLAEGQRLAGVTTDKGHNVRVQPLSDNRYFVIGYSMDNREFTSSDQMMTLQVTGGGSVSVEDVAFVNTHDQKVAFQNVCSEYTTGISETEVLSPADIYSVGGVMVKKNATSTEGLRSGVYIVNGKKHSKK